MDVCLFVCFKELIPTKLINIIVLFFPFCRIFKNGLILFGSCRFSFRKYGVRCGKYNTGSTGNRGRRFKWQLFIRGDRACPGVFTRVVALVFADPGSLCKSHLFMQQIFYSQLIAQGSSLKALTPFPRIP